jgi:hypothetical protein
MAQMPMIFSFRARTISQACDVFAKKTKKILKDCSKVLKIEPTYYLIEISESYSSHTYLTRRVLKVFRVPLCLWEN